jgi:hypothetical protein
MQEEAAEKQSEIDELRAKRAFGKRERGARAKELAKKKSRQELRRNWRRLEGNSLPTVTISSKRQPPSELKDQGTPRNIKSLAAKLPCLKRPS